MIVRVVCIFYFVNISERCLFYFEWYFVIYILVGENFEFVC